MNTKVQNEIYLSLLNKFVGQETDRVWMNTPFNACEKTISTNGHLLIATPYQNGFECRDEKVQSVYPFEYNMNFKIPLSEIKEKVKNFPMVDCFDESEVKCDACDGEGEVSYEFRHRGRFYSAEQECPVCDGQEVIDSGSNVPNGKKEYDTDMVFKIGECTFSISEIEELVFIAETLQAEYLTIVKQTGRHKPTWFVIKSVEVLLMPMLTTDEDLIAQIITI